MDDLQRAMATAAATRSSAELQAALRELRWRLRHPTVRQLAGKDGLSLLLTAIAALEYQRGVKSRGAEVAGVRTLLEKPLGECTRAERKRLKSALPVALACWRWARGRAADEEAAGIYVLLDGAAGMGGGGDGGAAGGN